MPVYFFYPHLLDGSATMFEAHELDGDVSALRKARQVLGEHTSATSVVVWRDDRIVARVGGAEMPAMLSSPSQLDARPEEFRS
jgi:hypothetical protein